MAISSFEKRQLVPPRGSVKKPVLLSANWSLICGAFNLTVKPLGANWRNFSNSEILKTSSQKDDREKEISMLLNCGKRPSFGKWPHKR